MARSTRHEAKTELRLAAACRPTPARSPARSSARFGKQLDETKRKFRCRELGSIVHGRLLI